jgi:hypothetical protein
MLPCWQTCTLMQPQLQSVLDVVVVPPKRHALLLPKCREVVQASHITLSQLSCTSRKQASDVVDLFGCLLRLDFLVPAGADWSDCTGGASSSTRLTSASKEG